jgi:hypothetical protein
MPSATRKTNANRGQARVHAGEAEHVLEEERAHPQRGRVGGDHRSDQHQREQQSAQENRQDGEDHDEDDRGDHPVVARGRDAQVALLGRRSAEQRGPPAHPADRGAQPWDGGERGVGVGIRPQGHVEAGPRWTELDRAQPRHLGATGERLAHGLHPRRVAHDHGGGRAPAGREPLLQQLLALDRLHGVAERVAACEAGVEVDEAD